MFADEVRRAVEASPRVGLPAVAEAMWKGWSAGHLTDAEAEELSALIEARKALPAATPSSSPGSPRRRVGSRPRSDTSMERRRRWAAAGRLPPTLAARFTLAEAAVLAVVAVEVGKGGDCRLAVGHLAALAGVSDTTVRNALRQARALGLVTIEERRLAAWRNDTNVVRIVSREWAGWLRLRAPGGRTPEGRPRPASAGARGEAAGAAGPRGWVQIRAAHAYPETYKAAWRRQNRG